MVGNTRIHLDEVEGLGSFLELEVVLGPGESMEAGVATATGLVTELGIQESDLIQTAYIDLLESKGQHNRLATENLS
jgi:adenylate cyclase class IV